jgi:hypothetical protein
MASMMNQLNWSQDAALRDWVRNSRLDGFGKVMAAADKSNPEHMAILERMRNAAKPAMGNMHKLMALSARKQQPSL